MDSNRSSDASSSIAEFLEKEKICQDSHKQTQFVGTNSHIDSVAPAQDKKNCSTSSDEEIGSLLCQMKELLSPVDLDYLDANEGRSVEDLLKEARALMQTSPLYNNFENKSVCIDELNNHGFIDSSPKEENVPETQNHSKDVDCDNAEIDNLMKEMEDLANSTSTILENSTNQSVVDIQKEMKTSQSFPPSSLRPSPVIISKSAAAYIPTGPADSSKPIEQSNEERQISQRSQINGHLSNSTPNSELSDFDERPYSQNELFSENCGPTNCHEENFKSIKDKDSEPKHDTPSKKLLKINTEALSLSDLEVPEKVSLTNSSRLSHPINLRLNMRNEEESKATDFNLRGDFSSTKKISEIDLRKMQEAYTEEIKRLNLTIELLQLKLAKYEAESTPDPAAADRDGDDGSASKALDGLDRLKAEIHTQERLIAGYQKENQRLFQEITAAKILKHSSSTIGLLEAAEKWRGNATEQDLMVRSEKIEEVTEYLNSNNMTFKIIIDDIQRAIRSENPEEGENDRNKPYRLTWQRYHRLNDHLQFHDYLEKEFPNMVQVVNIGMSVEGRPMRVLKISSGQPNAKAVWIDGGTHAREWISPATVSYIISEFVENRAAHGPYVSGVDFYIAPFINPDGYEYSHSVDRLWRKNRNTNNGGSCSGTDLNRNYGYKWGGAGSSRQPCKEIYAGNRAFSEPETSSISRFVLSNKDKIKAYVTFHSYGQYILYPWGYDRKVPPDYADLDRVGRKMAMAIRSAGGPAYTVGNSAATLYAASGGADDWAKGAAGIKYTYTIELRDNGVYGFVLPAQFIEPTARDAMAAVKVIAEEVYNLP